MTLVELEPILTLIVIIVLCVIMFSCCIFTCTDGGGPIGWVMDK